MFYDLIEHEIIINAENFENSITGAWTQQEATDNINMLNTEGYLTNAETGQLITLIEQLY